MCCNFNRKKRFTYKNLFLLSCHYQTRKLSYHCSCSFLASSYSNIGDWLLLLLLSLRHLKCLYLPVVSPWHRFSRLTKHLVTMQENKKIILNYLWNLISEFLFCKILEILEIEAQMNSSHFDQALEILFPFSKFEFKRNLLYCFSGIGEFYFSFLYRTPC